MNKLIKIADYEIQDAPQNNVGIQAESTIVTIAWRFKRHLGATVAGGYEPVSDKLVQQATANKSRPPTWKQDINEAGQPVWMQPVARPFDKGVILFDDALYACEYAISSGLNPLAHISVWYQGGQIQIKKKYTITKGWAEDRNPYSTEFAPMDENERSQHGLSKGDIGVIAFNMLDADKKLYVDMLAQLVLGGLKPAQAKRLALETVSKSHGVGVVKAAEMGGKKQEPKGRSWQWLAEKRALDDATNRSHGDMTPAAIAQASRGLNFRALKADDIPVLAAPGYPIDQPEEVQARYLELEMNDRDARARFEQMTDEQRRAKFAANVAVMRGPADDEIDLSEPEAVEDGDFTETTAEFPHDDPDFPVDSTSGDWLPDIEEFKVVCAKELKRPWKELEAILKALGKTTFKPQKAVELYQTLQSYLDEADEDKPMVPHQDGLFSDEPPQGNNYSE